MHNYWLSVTCLLFLHKLMDTNVILHFRLVSGDVRGQFRMLFSRVDTINKKTGPYSVSASCSVLSVVISRFLQLKKTLLLRSAPHPVTAKEEGLEGDVKFGRGGHQQGTQLNREIIPG